MDKVLTVSIFPIFNMTQPRGGFKGIWNSPPQGFDPLLTQRVPLLYHFEIFIFGDEPEAFLKACLRRQHILILKRERAEKKMQFFVKIFS